MKDDFIKAIRSKHKVQATFFSKEDKEYVTRTCAPMDYGPRRGINNQANRFHMWDYEGKEKPHTVSPECNLVTEIIILNDTFDPTDIVTWEPNWIIARDWGDLS